MFIFALWALLQVTDRAVSIPMRDGTKLEATVMRPAAAGRFPTLVYRTPYSRDATLGYATTFARAVRQGYAVVAVDVRGRYGSGGSFDPYRQEGKDGYDTIEWAAKQDWSTGEIGTFGLSYPGAVQWLAAIESPPHLKAMVPAMTFSRPTNFWYASGLPDLSWLDWTWFNVGPDVRRRLGLAGPTSDADVAAEWQKHKDRWQFGLPITDLPEFRPIAPWYFEWLTHPPDDPWWSWADLTDKYGRVSAAVLNLSGWHDDNYGPEGAITNFTGLRASRAGVADPKAFLLLGPWVHGTRGISDSSAKAHSGERVFGKSAGVDYDGEILRFLDRYVRGIENGVERTPPVRVFVMGENVWRQGDAWPLPGTSYDSLFLVAGSGTGGLVIGAPADGGSSLDSDPNQPIIDPYAGQSGAHDYRGLGGPGTLIFETAPLERDLRVVGPIRLTLTIQTDAPDVDLWGKLLDVEPNGTAWSLMSSGLDVLRASYRNGRRALLTGGPVTLSLDNLVTGNQFKAGHRLRLVVMPSFMPHLSRNLQTGKLEIESAEIRRATITVLTGANRSRLVLPILPPA